MLSRRSRFPAEEHAFAARLRQARNEGRELIDLTQSNPTKAGLPYDHVALTEALAQASAADYQAEPFGLPTARAAVAAELASLGQAVDEDQIVLTSSTSEAYGFALKLLTDPGDRIWASSPSYPLLDHLAQLEHVQIQRAALEYHGAWHYASVGDAGEADCRGLFVVNPNNPTGNFLKRDELKDLASLGVPIVSDEVFSAYAFEPDPSRACTLRDSGALLGIGLGGLSKHVGLPQLKLSWMVLSGEPEIVRAARSRLEVIADAYLSVATPVQVALEVVLQLGRRTREAIAARCRDNYAALTSMAQGSALSVLPVEGGWYAPLRMPAIQDDDAWAQALLMECDVVVQPGWLYDFPRPHFLVVSLLSPKPLLRTGFERILELVEQRSA